MLRSNVNITIKCQIDAFAPSEAINQLERVVANGNWSDLISTEFCLDHSTEFHLDHLTEIRLDALMDSSTEFHDNQLEVRNIFADKRLV